MNLNLANLRDLFAEHATELAVRIDVGDRKAIREAEGVLAAFEQVVRELQGWMQTNGITSTEAHDHLVGLCREIANIPRLEAALGFQLVASRTA